MLDKYRAFCVVRELSKLYRHTGVSAPAVQSLHPRPREHISKSYEIVSRPSATLVPSARLSLCPLLHHGMDIPRACKNLVGAHKFMADDLESLGVNDAA